MNDVKKPISKNLLYMPDYEVDVETMKDIMKERAQKFLQATLYRHIKISLGEKDPDWNVSRDGKGYGNFHINAFNCIDAKFEEWYCKNIVSNEKYNVPRFEVPIREIVRIHGTKGKQATLYRYASEQKGKDGANNVSIGVTAFNCNYLSLREWYNQKVEIQMDNIVLSKKSERLKREEKLREAKQKELREAKQKEIDNKPMDEIKLMVGDRQRIFHVDRIYHPVDIKDFLMSMNSRRLTPTEAENTVSGMQEGQIPIVRGMRLIPYLRDIARTEGLENRA